MRCFPWFLVLLTIGGCSPDYPFDKPGTWSIGQASSANDANLRAMVANPDDLASGRGESTSLGAEAGPPVGLLFSGQRRVLPNIDTLDVTLAPSTSGPSGNAAQ